MAICKWCKQEKAENNKSCLANTLVEFPDGTSFPSVPHVTNIMTKVEWLIKWRECQREIAAWVAENEGLDSTKIIDTETAALKRYERYATGRCTNCGIARGGKHHLGCSVESCPRCSGQLISCGCYSDN